MNDPEKRPAAMSLKDQYMMVWEHVNRLMGRRQAMTGVHLTVNAAIIGATAYILKGKVTFVGWQLLAILLLLLAGMAASYMWTRLVTHYSTLLGWWYDMLRELEASYERELPNFITREYKRFYTRPVKGPRLWFTRHELRLARLFIIAYAAFSVIVLVGLVNSTWT